jgi:hypothetical protein
MKRLRGSERSTENSRVRPVLVLSALAVLACKALAEGSPAPSASAVAERPMRQEPGPTACGVPPQGDLAGVFPSRLAGFCVDRHGEPGRYGGRGERALAAGCADLGLDCSVLERLGLERMRTLRYVETKGQEAPRSPLGSTSSA